eukprot:6344037-Amphidinium_carterae.1
MHVQGAPLIYAASFKFLGSVYTVEGSSAADLPARLGAARASWAQNWAIKGRHKLENHPKTPQNGTT